MQQSILVGEPIYKFSSEVLLPKMFSAMFRIVKLGNLAIWWISWQIFAKMRFPRKSLTSILEPLMIVVVAGVVAVILVAMYLPMFNMMSTVK